MKISIIIPPLFSIVSLRRIIDNISRQSYPQYELIVISETGLELNHLVDLDQNIDSKIRLIEISRESVNSIFQAFLNSSGDIIWIIDRLDEFHPEKFDIHVKLFAENPAIGGIRSGFVRKEVGNVFHSLNIVGSVMDLDDIILDGSVYFSDTIFRREWVEKFFSKELLPEYCLISFFSLHFYIRTLLAGCRIVGLNQAINLRHKSVDDDIDIKSSGETAFRCLDQLFENPDIAPSIAKWKDKATAQAYLHWSVKAFANGESKLGQKLFRSSILLNRSILDIGAFAYFNKLIDYALLEREAIDEFITKNIKQLSPEFAWMSQYLNESIARGYFYKAVEDIAFARIESANQAIKQANGYGMNLTEADLMKAVSILSDYEIAYGYDSVKTVIKDLAQLGRFVDPKKINWVRGTWLINRAFAKYRENNYKAVPQKIINALLISPGYAFNPGVRSIFFKSLFQTVKTISHHKKLGKQQSIANNYKGNTNAAKSKI